MQRKALIIGNDLITQKLLVDILELTFKKVTIDKIISFNGIDEKLNKQLQDYDLIIIDFYNNLKNVNEDLILHLRNNHPSIISSLIFIFRSLDGKPDDNVLFDIPYVIKPFSLDVFSGLLEKICIN
jgi:hypothetical protein